MDPMEIMRKMMEGDDESEHINRDVEAIFEALEVKPLEGLKYGDVLKQKQLGTGWAYQGDEKMRAVFIRYTVPDLDRHLTHGEIVREYDMVIAIGVDPKNGMVLMYAANSKFFEKAEATS